MFLRLQIEVLNDVFVLESAHFLLMEGSMLHFRNGLLCLYSKFTVAAGVFTRAYLKVKK